MIVVLLVMYYVMVVRNGVDAVPWLAYGMPPNIHLTAAGWYALIVSNSIFEFLLGLSLWKWLLWTVFSFRISRLNLNLIPTHPDGNGGLGLPLRQFHLQSLPQLVHRGDTTSSRMV
jgi:hypothetical protein